jgi:hypothetical protein
MGLGAQTCVLEASDTWDNYGHKYQEHELTMNVTPGEGNVKPSLVFFVSDAGDAGSALRSVSFNKETTVYESYGDKYGRSFVLYAHDANHDKLMIWYNEYRGYVKFINNNYSSDVACDLTHNDADKIFELVADEVKKLGFKKAPKEDE